MEMSWFAGMAASKLGRISLPVELSLRALLLVQDVSSFPALLLMLDAHIE
jgi:hypothetical protein